MDKLKEIRYEITFEKNDEQFTHTVSLPLSSLEHFVVAADPPDCCKLEYNQCDNCPLSPKEKPYCPVALRLIPFVEMNACVSYDKVFCQVSMGDKVIQKQTVIDPLFQEPAPNEFRRTVTVTPP